MNETSLGDLKASDYRRIADLKHDRGYLLLCDYVQSHLDNILDKLSKHTLPDDESLRLLRHWRSMRAMHSIMITQPEMFGAQAETMESKEEV